MTTGTTAETAVSQVLARTRQEGRAAFIGYLPVGYPDVDTSIEAMVTMVRSGVDIVEIGLPYTDPLMDGPVIQTAATGALAAGVHVRDVFRAAAAVRDAGGASVVMTYWNPVLRYGPDAFARDLAQSGASGLITPDLVPDEAGAWLAASDAYGLDRVFLVAPSSTPAAVGEHDGRHPRVRLCGLADGRHRSTGVRRCRCSGTRRAGACGHRSADLCRTGCVDRRAGAGGRWFRRRCHRRVCPGRSARRQRR